MRPRASTSYAAFVKAAAVKILDPAVKLAPVDGKTLRVKHR
jgi:hypothetical protein